MGGLFGAAAHRECAQTLFFGTDYHSHLGTIRGGLATWGKDGITRAIHDITNTPFRTKFESDLEDLRGNLGIGVISDFDDQPVLVRSHLGTFGVVTVGRINNAEHLAKQALADRSTHFSEVGASGINPTELVATIISREESFAAGIRKAQEAVDGSCSMLILTADGIIAARDRLGRTPLVLGTGSDGTAVSSETCAFPNLGFRATRELGPGEAVRITPDGVDQVLPAGEVMQICAFLWVYYGYPSSTYERINVEDSRYRCGAALARRDDVEVDCVAGIPDSGTAHAIGYANQAGIPYRRPFVKYTPTWPRSFMPQVQSIRDLVARMKLIPVRPLIEGKRLLFCEDSIVRGTQLQDTVQGVFDYGAREIHMRPACPPLVYGCKFLNFSRSKSEFDLAARRAVRDLEGEGEVDLTPYTDPDSDAYAAMLDRIRDRLKLTSLRYQRLDDLVEAVGLPREKLCTYCWDGAE